MTHAHVGVASNTKDVVSHPDSIAPPSAKGLDSETLNEILVKLREHVRAEDERRSKFGHVRPILTAEMNETQFIAVGNELAWSKEWRTFPDFLRDYIRHKLGRPWWEAELNKPLELRHEILEMVGRDDSFPA